ncbi:MFS transporter small subunit [Streptomyces sp. NBC_00683]
MSTRSRKPLMVLVWLWVAVPFGYGLYELARKATQLFTG